MNKSNIIGVDFRIMGELFWLENLVYYGMLMCFCVDRKRNWFCFGMSYGVLDLWDLRFKIRLRGWGVLGKGEIYRVMLYLVKGRGRWVLVSGGMG